MAKAKAAKKQGKRPARLNNMEAIAVFCYWLAGREAPIIFSNKHDFSAISELMGAFQKTNGLPGLRADMPVAKYPDELHHVTNAIQANTTSVRLTVPKALQEVQNLFANLSRRDQLTFFSQIVEGQRRDAADQLQSAEDEEKKRLRSLQTATQHFRDVQRIINGDLVLMV